MGQGVPGFWFARTTDRVQRVIGMRVRAVMDQMMAEMLRLVSRAVPTTLDASALAR